MSLKRRCVRCGEEHRSNNRKFPMKAVLPGGGEVRICIKCARKQVYGKK